MNNSYDNLINAILHGQVLKSFQIGIYSELIVDASEYALGAVLEQQGHPVLCISRRLSKAEIHYSQTQKEALAIFWAVRRLHKYLFGTKFRIITDHQALQHIFCPNASVGKATSSMLQRWALELSAYDYDIEHRAGKKIPQADYLSRHAYQDPPEQHETTVMMVNPLPLDRNLLIKETALAYGSVLSGLRNGWSISAKKRFPVLYANRDKISMQPDGIITYDERAIIPPTCRQAILQHLHLGHLGRDKMKSLARLICWWPTINMDIVTFVKECSQCQRKPRTHNNWKPWPVPFTAMQRIHVDYCGPFLNKFYALVIEDAYSKFPEVFITTNATAEFTKKALRHFFAREGVAQVLVSDNGTHFTAGPLQEWLKSLGCHVVYTAPRHPQSNGLAENFVRTIKTAIKAASPTTIDQLNSAIDTFLLQYRNAVHSTTGKTPAMLFKGRNLRSSANIDTTEVTFFRGNNSRPCEGLVLGSIGQRMFNIMDQTDGSIHRRHIDQINLTKSMTDHDNLPTPQLSPVATHERVPIPQTNSTPQTIDINVEQEDSNVSRDASPVPNITQTTPIIRRGTRIKKKPSYLQDYDTT